MAAATTTTPTPWCAVVTASYPWTYTCLDARRAPSSSCTALSSCRRRSAAPTPSHAEQGTMTRDAETLARQVETRFAGVLARVPSIVGELTYEVPATKLVERSEEHTSELQ